MERAVAAGGGRKPKSSRGQMPMRQIVVGGFALVLRGDLPVRGVAWPPGRASAVHDGVTARGIIVRRRAAVLVVRLEIFPGRVQCVQQGDQQVDVALDPAAKVGSDDARPTEAGGERGLAGQGGEAVAVVEAERQAVTLGAGELDGQRLGRPGRLARRPGDRGLRRCGRLGGRPSSVRSPWSGAGVASSRQRYRRGMGVFSHSLLPSVKRVEVRPGGVLVALRSAATFMAA